MVKVLLGLILGLALFLRVVQIDSVPPGVFIDEASIGLDAYSLGVRGEDQYGKSYPMYFRSFATYQSPLYIYLSVIPIKILGLTPLAVRLVSIISGVLLVLVTFLLIKQLKIKRDNVIGLISAGIVAIAPWSIFFSRGAIEGNLGILIYVSALFSFLKGINKKSAVLIFTSFVLLALTNYAYHAYRVLSVITLLLMLVVFYKNIFNRKIFVISVITFCLIIIPQLFYTFTDGSIRRYQQLEYTSYAYFNQHGGEFKFLPFGQQIFILRTFLSRYIDYFSPKSLFLDTDPTYVRGIPDLAVYYSWFIIPWLYGLYIIRKKVNNKILLFFGLLLLGSVIPSAVTRDTLYTLRLLPYFWIVGIIIAFGMDGLLEYIKLKKIKYSIFCTLLILSLSIFYFHYFVLVKNERKTEHSGLPYELFQYTTQHRNNHYVIDLTDELAYQVAAFIYKPNLEEFEKQANVNLDDYYNDLKVNTNYKFENVEFRPVQFEIDSFKEMIVVGDEQTIPDEVAYENGYEPVVRYKSTDLHSITIYKTHPKEKCIRMPKTLYPEVKCTPEIMNGN